MLQQEMHICVDIKGAHKAENVKKVRLFNYMLGRLDTDWPYVVARYGGGSSTFKRMVCKKCGGRLYRNPRLKPGDVKILGKQLGLNVKVRRFGRASRCDTDSKGTCYTFQYEHGCVRRPVSL